MRQALKDIPAERLVLSSDCGMGREGMSRRHAFYKMVALVQGTNIVRKELGLPVADEPGRRSEVLAASLVGHVAGPDRADTIDAVRLEPDATYVLEVYRSNMINAAIVGLGWWGKTLVEAVQEHERRRSGSSRARRGRNRPRSRRSPTRRTSDSPTATRRCSPIPASTPWCWPRRIRCIPRR